MERRILARGDRTAIAYNRRDGKSPGVVFLPGFRSDRQGTKALMLDELCGHQGRAYLRFDYSGHGDSSGEFRDGTVGQWTADAIDVIDQITEGPQVLVGSSMGGWIMLLAALARPDRVAGLVGIASAPDFTEDLMWGRASEEVKDALRGAGVYYEPSQYENGPVPITMNLIEEGRKHLLLGGPIALECPVVLLHGMMDEDVPWQTSLKIAECLVADDVVVTLIKDGGHRLSSERNLARIRAAMTGLCERLEGAPS